MKKADLIERIIRNYKQLGLKPPQRRTLEKYTRNELEKFTKSNISTNNTPPKPKNDKSASRKRGRPATTNKPKPKRASLKTKKPKKSKTKNPKKSKTKKSSKTKKQKKRTQPKQQAEPIDKEGEDRKAAVNNTPHEEYTPDTTHEDDYIPEFDIVERIKSAIDGSIPDHAWDARTKTAINLGEYKDGLKELLDDIINDLEGEDLKRFIRYLKENEEEIFRLIDEAGYAAKSGYAGVAVANLQRVATIVKGGVPLTREEAEYYDKLYDVISNELDVWEDE